LLVRGSVITIGTAAMKCSLTIGLSLLHIFALVPEGAGVGLKSRSSTREDHPVAGVIELLQGLRGQVVEEGRTEEVTYAKFASWCSDSTRSLDKSVTTARETIDKLKSEVDAKTKENATLTKQIAELEEEIFEHGQADTAATSARADASSLYNTADGDLATTIQAFTLAITELEKAKNSTSASLMQTKALRGALQHLPLPAFAQLSELQLAKLSEAVRQVSKDISGDLPDFLAKGDYGARVEKYSFKSDNIIDLLKELKMVFEDERVEGTKAETQEQNAFHLAKNARDAAVQAAEDAKSEKGENLVQVQFDLATAKSSLDATQGDLAADESSLEDTQRDCQMKKTEWEERSKLRANEVAAMDEGIKILAKVSGIRTEPPTNPVLPTSPVGAETAETSESTGGAALLQTDPKARAVNLIRSEASRLHSSAFSRFAETLAAKVSGPFEDVNNMIQKMIFRLMAEQTDEDDHKNWCDLELGKTNASKVEKEEKISQFDLKLTDEKGSVDELVQEIDDANEKVADIVKFMNEADEVRNAGKTENDAAIADAKAAQTAIAKAIAVLEQFYKETGMVAKEAWEFVQRESVPVELPETPSTWDSSYTGVTDPKQPDGIITVLERISSDFSQMEADTKSQEEIDQKNYQEETKEAGIELARLRKKIEMKGQEKHRLLDRIAAFEKSKKHTTAQLEAVEQYLKDLAPACLEGDSTYEDRKAARSAEISALKEAQVILADAFKNTTEGSLVAIRRVRA